MTLPNVKCLLMVVKSSFFRLECWPHLQADMGTWTERYDSTHMLGLVVYDVRMHDDVHRWKDAFKSALCELEGEKIPFR